VNASTHACAQNRSFWPAQSNSLVLCCDVTEIDYGNSQFAPTLGFRVLLKLRERVYRGLPSKRSKVVDVPSTLDDPQSFCHVRCSQATVRYCFCLTHNLDTSKTCRKNLFP
jgi:hypothetical protein